MTNTSNVVVGRPRVGGAIFRIPLGVMLPTDAVTDLPPEAASHGYVSSEGFEQAISKAFEAIRAWGGDEIARPRTEHSVTMSFTLVEAKNATVARTIWGEDSVTVIEPTESHGRRIAVAYTGQDLPPAAWVFDLADRGNLRRIVAPHAEIVTEDFTRTFADNAPISYPVTLALRPNEDGVFFYEYSDDGTPLGAVTVAGHISFATPAAVEPAEAGVELGQDQEVTAVDEHQVLDVDQGLDTYTFGAGVEEVAA